MTPREPIPEDELERIVVQYNRAFGGYIAITAADIRHVINTIAGRFFDEFKIQELIEALAKEVQKTRDAEREHKWRVRERYQDTFNWVDIYEILPHTNHVDNKPRQKPSTYG